MTDLLSEPFLTVVGPSPRSAPGYSGFSLLQSPWSEGSFKMGNQADEDTKVTKLYSNKATFTDGMMFCCYISQKHGYSRPPPSQAPTELSGEGVLSIWEVQHGGTGWIWWWVQIEWCHLDEIIVGPENGKCSWTLNSKLWGQGGS